MAREEKEKQQCFVSQDGTWPGRGGFQPDHTSEATLGAKRQLCSLASHPHPLLSLKPGSLAFLQNPKHGLFPWINLVTTQVTLWL